LNNKNVFSANVFVKLHGYLTVAKFSITAFPSGKPRFLAMAFDRGWFAFPLKTIKLFGIKEFLYRRDLD
jgi:hypothetical protein